MKLNEHATNAARARHAAGVNVLDTIFGWTREAAGLARRKRRAQGAGPTGRDARDPEALDPAAAAEDGEGAARRAPEEPVVRLRVGRPNISTRARALVCRLRGHRPEEPRLHRVRVGRNVTHRYLVTRCGFCTRLLTTERIGRKTGAVRRIDVRKEQP
jgi:hypothetical protein